MLASVILCTRNRAAKLPQALDSLSRMEPPEGGAVEVLIVDNGSTDETREAAERYRAAHPGRFSYLFEPARGKSAALNRGVQEARGEILLFTDDDCVVDELWAAAAAAEFEHDPDLAVLGGRVELFDTRDADVSTVPFRERCVVACPTGILLTPYVIGCNMAIRRGVFDRIGGFDLRMGPGSRVGLVAEDTDLVYRAFRHGFKVAYAPSMRVRHDHGRRSSAELTSLLGAYAAGRGALYLKHILRGDVTALKVAWWELSGTLRALRRSLRLPEWIGQFARLIADLVRGAFAMLWAVLVAPGRAERLRESR